MNDYFKLIRNYQGKPITLLINGSPEKGGAHVRSTGEIIDFKGSLFFTTMFKIAGEVQRIFGVVRLKEDEIEWMNIEHQESAEIIQEQYPAFLQMKEGATDLDERQLILILRIIKRRMAEHE